MGNFGSHKNRRCKASTNAQHQWIKTSKFELTLIKLYKLYKMEKHSTLSDEEFEIKFKTCQLNPSDFTHEAHLRLAWIKINTYGIKVAEQIIHHELKTYVSHFDAQDKFNLTLTRAATKAVYHFMLKSNADNFKDFIDEFPRLKYNFRALMDHHYGFDIYNSSEAKTQYLAPDLVPFD